jgi:hypothetical protein
MRTSRTSKRTVTRLATVAAVICLGLVGAPAPAQAQGMITFVAYYDDANHDNLVGASTFSACPGDPAYHWGLYTAYYTIESEPCG